jgi:hypothetical protein
MKLCPADRGKRRDSHRQKNAMRTVDEIRHLVLKEIELLRRPIDFVDLERRGIISKDGTWYRVRNLWELPVYVAHRIREVAVDVHGTKVKFTTRGVKTLAKQVEEMAVEEGLDLAAI